MTHPTALVDDTVQDRPDAGGLDVTGTGAHEESTRRYVRSPQDVLRLVLFAVVAVVVFGLTVGVDDAILGFEEDVIALFAFLTPAIERVVGGGLEILMIVLSVTVYLIPLLTRRYRLFGYIMAAAASAFFLMSGAQIVVDRNVDQTIANELAERAGLTTDTASGPIGLAQLTAMLVVVGPFVSRRWRRAGMGTVIAVTLTSLLVSTQLPVELLLALPVGATCGAAVLVAFGRPDRRPTLAAIRAALADAGQPVIAIQAASVDARGSTPYFATAANGDQLFVKVLGAEERAADLLFRAYRFLRLKDVGDDRPFSSLRRTIEHEALVALLARDVGVRTPRMRGVADVGADSMLLAYEMIDGRSLDGVPEEALTDEVARAVWEQVAVLREHRIAHRDLRLANVFVAADGEPWMIDFGFSEVAVSDALLDADVAQLLASMATVVGAERTVATAVDVLGTRAVADALPRLQSTALSGATQAALKQHPGLLKALQKEVQTRCGVEDVSYVELDRINRRLIVTVAALALATYFLFPQLADLPGIIDQIEEANWWWLPLIVVASAVTYIGASISLAGAVPDRLPAGPLLAASVGSSFASKLAPAGLGGMALFARFLQKQGVDRAVAVSGVGLNTVAGVFGHVTLIGVFLIWAGRDAFGSFSLPDPGWFLLGLGIAVGLIGLGFVIPVTRRALTTRLWPTVARAFDGITEVLRRPVKLAMLLGGSILITLAYLTTLYLSVEAFGGGLAFATVGAVFLVGSAVAQAAPTPGGLGAMEAALIGGLVAAGLANAVAVPAVFLYRLITFWLPILPGWLSFQWLQSREYL